MPSLSELWASTIIDHSGRAKKSNNYKNSYHSKRSSIWRSSLTDICTGIIVAIISVITHLSIFEETITTSRTCETAWTITRISRDSVSVITHFSWFYETITTLSINIDNCSTWIVLIVCSIRVASDSIASWLIKGKCFTRCLRSINKCIISSNNYDSTASWFTRTWKCRREWNRTIRVECLYSTLRICTTYSTTHCRTCISIAWVTIITLFSSFANTISTDRRSSSIATETRTSVTITIISVITLFSSFADVIPTNRKTTSVWTTIIIICIPIITFFSSFADTVSTDRRSSSITTETRAGITITIISVITLFSSFADVIPTNRKTTSVWTTIIIICIPIITFFSSFADTVSTDRRSSSITTETRAGITITIIPIITLFSSFTDIISTHRETTCIWATIIIVCISIITLFRTFFFAITTDNLWHNYWSLGIEKSTFEMCNFCSRNNSRSTLIFEVRDSGVFYRVNRLWIIDICWDITSCDTLTRFCFSPDPGSSRIWSTRKTIKTIGHIPYWTHAGSLICVATNSTFCEVDIFLLSCWNTRAWHKYIICCIIGSQIKVKTLLTTRSIRDTTTTHRIGKNAHWYEENKW